MGKHSLTVAVTMSVCVSIGSCSNIRKFEWWKFTYVPVLDLHGCQRGLITAACHRHRSVALTILINRHDRILGHLQVHRLVRTAAVSGHR